MAEKPLPPPELLRQLLRYEPETGKLFWRIRRPEHFTGGFHGVAAHCRTWNTRYSGKQAGSPIGPRGCIAVACMGAKVLAHRVIWAMKFNDWPDTIDHIDGDPSNNRLENLRSVTQQENMKNKAMTLRNTSGHIGVSWIKNRRKWRAFINASDKQIHLGCFNNKEQAIAARKAAEKEYGYHPNHGLSSTDRRLSSD